VHDRGSRGAKVAVAVEFQIIDVRRGSVRASNTVVHSFTGDFSNKTGTSEESQRERLANLCADDIAHALVPHRDTLDVPLETMVMGTGASAMREGNKLARKGQWAAAMEQWQSALRENPDNDGALYNLGLAYEALGDFRTARENFQAALRNSNKSAYSDALVRIESSTSSHRLAMQQIRQARQSRSASLSLAAIFRDRFDGSSFSRNSTMQSLPQIRPGH